MTSRLLLNTVKRRFSSVNTIKNDEIKPIFTNRNPRNLEYLRIGYKPDGYYVDKPGRNYWHKLYLTKSSRHVTVSLRHYANGEVLSASTQEWAIKKQLYSAKDVSAYINLARVFAQRCMESGLIEFMCDLEVRNEDGRVANFLRVLKECGLKLTESEQLQPILPWTRGRPEKPWETFE